MTPQNLSPPPTAWRVVNLEQGTIKLKLFNAAHCVAKRHFSSDNGNSSLVLIELKFPAETNCSPFSTNVSTPWEFYDDVQAWGFFRGFKQADAESLYAERLAHITNPDERKKASIGL